MTAFLTEVANGQVFRQSVVERNHVTMSVCVNSGDSDGTTCYASLHLLHFLQKDLLLQMDPDKMLSIPITL